MTAAVTDHRRRMVRLVSIETAAKKGCFQLSAGGQLRTDAGSSFHVLAVAIGYARSPKWTAEWRERPETL